MMLATKKTDYGYEVSIICNRRGPDYGDYLTGEGETFKEAVANLQLLTPPSKIKWYDGLLSALLEREEQITKGDTDGYNYY